MIIHLLRFSYRPDVDDQGRADVLAALNRMGATEWVSWSVIGQDLGHDGYTHAYCVGIKDLDALQRYLYDPQHREVIITFASALATLTAVDLSNDMDPGLAEAIERIHRRWLEHDPEIVNLLASVPAK